MLKRNLPDDGKEASTCPILDGLDDSSSELIKINNQNRRAHRLRRRLIYQQGRVRGIPIGGRRAKVKGPYKTASMPDEPILVSYDSPKKPTKLGT
jgi:hypothetical protein